MYRGYGTGTDELQGDTRERLNDLVDFLNTGTDEAKKLWWVLTALRGPDNDSQFTKYATTAVIRHAIGLRKGVGNGATVESDATSGPLDRDLLDRDREMYHFNIHARRAFEALGLIWEARNVDMDFDKVEMDVVYSLMNKEPE